MGGVCHLPAHTVSGDPAEWPSPLSPRMFQPNHSPPPSGRGTCPRRQGCCACWAAPCVSPLWLLQGSLPVKRDFSLETRGDHTSSGSWTPPLLPFYQMSVILEKSGMDSWKEQKLFPLWFFFWGPELMHQIYSSCYQLNRNKSTVGAFFRFALFLSICFLVGLDNISDIFLIQARQNANHTFSELQRGLGGCFVSSQCFIFHHTR